MEISLEKRGSDRSWRPSSVVSAIECICLWRVAADLSKKLPHRLYLRADCDLDRLPLYSTRNCHGYFHPVRNSGVGNSARFWAILRSNRESVASHSAIVDGCSGHNGDGAVRRNGGATAYRGRASAAKKHGRNGDS